jgi:hypothetical protein
MKYNAVPTECEAFLMEVEDYTVNLIAATADTAAQLHLQV